MNIEPGDLMLGDADGVLCVPRADVEAVYLAAERKHATEVEQMKAIEGGRSDRSWVDASLTRLGLRLRGLTRLRSGSVQPLQR